MRKGGDPRTILTFDSEGITIDCEGERRGIAWTELVEIRGYRSDGVLSAELTIRLCETRDFVAITPWAEGFAALMEELERRYPMLRGWRNKLRNSSLEGPTVSLVPRRADERTT